MAVIEIIEESPLRGEIRRLLAEAGAYAASLYPPERGHGVPAEDFSGTGGRVFVARADGVAVGCAVLLRDGADGELQRMFVLERTRGIGAGRAILRALEAAARADGIAVIRMESGVRDAEALGLFRRSGYVERGPFGAYRADPLSVFLEKVLA